MAGLTVTELDEDIASCRATIRACETSMQSVSRAGLSYVRVNYEAACKRLDRLLAMRNRANGGSILQVDVSAVTTTSQGFEDPDSP